MIFVQSPGDVQPVLGDYLGDFTDELTNGDFITEFCSGEGEELWVWYEERQVLLQSTRLFIDRRRDDATQLSSVASIKSSNTSTPPPCGANQASNSSRLGMPS